MISRDQVLRAFCDKLAEHGIAVSDPSRLELDGNWHRAHVEGDRGRAENLSYRIHFDDRPAGFFEDHKRGVSGTFSVTNGEDMDPAARAAAQARWRDQQTQREREREDGYRKAAKTAQEALDAAPTATAEHPYLQRKGIVPARLKLDEQGRLMIPVYSAPREVASYQTIDANGDKLFMPGGRMAGSYHSIAGPDPARVLVCEGYATGAALVRATGHSVACAMSAGNLAAVIVKLQALFQDGREIVACPDNDWHTAERTGRNPGLDAVADTGVRVIAPQFPADADPKHTDWDDWLRHYGNDAGLRDLVAGAVTPAEPVIEPAEPELDPPAEAPIEGELVDLPRAPDSVWPTTQIWAACGLEKTDKGLPHPNFDNASRLLERHPEFAGVLWYDEFLQRVLIGWGGEPRALRDADEDRIHLWMQRVAGIHKMPKAAVQQAINVVAHANRRNELTEWLDALRWDGRDRLASLMPRGFSSSENPYTAAVGRCWVVSMVARAYAPGCKVDTMPVFEGSQGTRKSTALQTLVGERWFTEIHDDIMSKDFFITLQGNLLVEISEMHAFGRAEVERIKGVITCRNDRFRAPYGRIAEDHPRQCVFGGTTNRDDWNRDETGARRFWPIKCLAEIDLVWIHANREQLFAEAVARYRRGESWWDVPAEDARREQDARRAHDTWQEPFAEYLIGRTFVSTGDVLGRVVGLDLSKQTIADQRRAGTVLRSLGWRPVVRREGVKTTRGWEPDRFNVTDDPVL